MFFISHNPVSPLGSLFGIVFMLVAYGFFILGLICVSRSRTSRLRELGRERYVGVKYARLVLLKSSLYVTTCHIGALLAALVAGFLVDEFMRRAVFVQPLGAFMAPLGLVGRLLFFFVFAGFLVLLGLSLIQAAKVVGYSRPTRTLCVISFPLIVVGRLFQPLVWLLSQTAGRVFTAAGVSIPVERELVASAKQITEMVELSSKAGEIEEDEKEMIEHVFTFADTVVREVMTPRKDIISVNESASLDEILDIFSRERLSRLLVTGEQLDEVKGVLHVKDLLSYVGKPSKDFALARMIRPVMFVANSQKVDNLLKLLRKEAMHIAVVLDEHGGVDGVVTIEDLIEEIVGEIFDEYDSPQEECEVLETRSGELLVDGTALIDDLNAEHDLGIPKGEYDTIAGFLINRLSRLPSAGDFVEHEDLLLKAEKVEGSRVTRVRIVRKSRAVKVSPRVQAAKSSPNDSVKSPTDRISISR